jgi:hypothetical protein
MSIADWKDSVKGIAKWLLRSTQRKKVTRETIIKKLQNKLLPQLYPADARKIIIFFLDGVDLKTGKENVSGGLLSIHSIFEETIKIKEVHDAEALLCTMKNTNLFFKFSTFDSPYRVFHYEQLEKYFKKAEKIIAHVPEYLVEYFLYQLKSGRLDYLISRQLHVNILNQNIQLMPSVEIVRQLRQCVIKVTQTTAHERYATESNRKRYDIPLHHFSTFIAPERYKFVTYNDKINRIAFSPDNPEKNAIVIDKLKKELPGYEIVIIGGFTYEQFKEFISKTKFTFTFGEGLDGYYCETVLTGGVCMAVYNEEFFTPDFKMLETVHKSFDELVAGCVSQIQRLDQSENFTRYNRMQFDLLTDHYKFSEYQDNIRKFYLEEYTFL